MTQKFQVGDIVYAIPHTPGCSYRHEFGFITNVTKSGRYRVQPIGSKAVGEREDHIFEDGPSKGALFSTHQQVAPDEDCQADWQGNRFKTFLITAEGERRTPSWNWASFEKYDDSMVLKNYYDMGD